MIKPNTYPLSENSENLLNHIKSNFLSKGSSYLDCLDTEIIKELNKLSHPDILLYNIVRNKYIFKRFITVLMYNYSYDKGKNFEDNKEMCKNKKVIDFVTDIIKVANISCVPESTKQIYLRTLFVKHNLEKQQIDHLEKANFEFDIMKNLLLKKDNMNLYNWLHNKKILDVGYGPGHFLGELEINNVTEKNNLHGIDIASYIKDKYIDKFYQHFYVDKLQFPTTLPKVDIISFFMTLHHIELYKMHIILLQLYDILNDDGYLYVKEHLVECQDDMTFFKFMETYFYFVEDYIPNVPVEDNYYTKEALEEVFKLYGFILTTQFEINKQQPFKPFYYLFKKNINYDKNEITESEKITQLTIIITKMKASNVFSNGNLFKYVELNDF